MRNPEVKARLQEEHRQAQLREKSIREFGSKKDRKKKQEEKQRRLDEVAEREVRAREENDAYIRERDAMAGPGDDTWYHEFY